MTKLKETVASDSTKLYNWQMTITSNGGAAEVWINHQTQNSGSSQNYYTNVFPSSTMQINTGQGLRDYWTVFVKDTSNNLWGCDINVNENGPNDSTTLTLLIDVGNKVVYFNFGDGDDDFSLSLVAVNQLG